MADPYVEVGGAAAEIETREWLESLGYVLEHSGPGRVRELLEQLLDHAFVVASDYVKALPDAVARRR